MKKYSSNKKLKRIKSVKLTIPAQGIKYIDNTIQIPCLKLSLNFDSYTKKQFNNTKMLIKRKTC